MKAAAARDRDLDASIERYLVDELYRVAGLWHDEGDWSHVWPVGFAWIWTDDERGEAVDAVIEGLELVGQVRMPLTAIR